MQIDLNQIISLIDMGNYSKAETIALEIYNKDKSNYLINKALGTIYLLQKKYKKCLEYFNVCLALDPSDFDILLNLSHVHAEMFDVVQADHYGQKALAIKPNDPRPLINMTENKIQMGNFESAYQLISKSIDLHGGLAFIASKPEHESILLKYLDIIFVLKEKEEVIKTLDYILNQKFNPTIFLYWSNYDPQSIPSEFINLAIKKLSEPYANQIIKSKNLIGIYFALAVLNKNNQHEMEKYYILGNQCASNMVIYNAITDQQRIKNLKSIFNLNEVQNYKNKDESFGKGLVFIVGMPRSGTTLTESMLAIAENTASAGETTAMFHLCMDYYSKKNENSTKPDFELIGNEYLRIINSLTKDAKFKIEKLPGNYYHIGFIIKALPGAKIIHVKRDPWDNAISLFQQQYVANIPYSFDFLNIAVHYANYEHLMTYWHNSGLLNKNNFYEIDYEYLVSNNSDAASELFTFCGLSGNYDQKEREKHFARTASKNQVNKPIYKTSLGKSIFVDFKEKFKSDLGLQREFWQKYS